MSGFLALSPSMCGAVLRRRELELGFQGHVFLTPGAYSVIRFAQKRQETEARKKAGQTFHQFEMTKNWK